MARNATVAAAPANVPPVGQRGWAVWARFADVRGMQTKQFTAQADVRAFVANSMLDPKCFWVHAENWDEAFAGKSWPQGPNGMGVRPQTHTGEKW